MMLSVGKVLEATHRHNPFLSPTDAPQARPRNPLQGRRPAEWHASQERKGSQPDSRSLAESTQYCDHGLASSRSSEIRFPQCRQMP